MEKELQDLIKKVDRDTEKAPTSDIRSIGDKIIWIIQSNLSYNAFEIHITARAMYQTMQRSSQFADTKHLILGNDILDLVFEHDESVGFDIDDRDDDMAVHDYLDTYFDESDSEGRYDEDTYYEYHFNKQGEPYFTLLDIDALVSLYHKMCEQAKDTAE